MSAHHSLAGVGVCGTDTRVFYWAYMPSVAHQGGVNRGWVFARLWCHAPVMRLYRVFVAVVAVV